LVLSGVGGALAYRKAYGTFAWWRDPARISWCGRVYLRSDGPLLTRTAVERQRASLPGDEPYPVTAVATIPPLFGHPVLAAVTPNGNWERWLDLAENWRMKIPEGPHTFLTTRALAATIGPGFEIVEHRTFLACPGGPPALSAAVDRLPGLAALGWGFFQYVVAKRRAP